MLAQKRKNLQSEIKYIRERRRSKILRAKDGGGIAIALNVDDEIFNSISAPSPVIKLS